MTPTHIGLLHKIDTVDQRLLTTVQLVLFSSGIIERAIIVRSLFFDTWLVALVAIVLLIAKSSHAFAPKTRSAAAFTTLKQSSKTNNMVAQDMDGKAIAKSIRGEIKAEVEEMADTKPGLAVILVGSRRDSQTYVNMKKKACAECGITSFGYDFEDTVTEAELLQCIADLNANPMVHGILVQLPLPQHMKEATIVNAVHPDKDVDGLHPLNVAKLCSTSTHADNAKLDWSNLQSVPFHMACTPQGCIELLDRSDITIKGKKAVVIGRSNLVGLPVAMLLMHRDATVTIVHSKTTDIEEVVSRADIVVAAIGKAKLVTKDWLKEGAVVIDVGINSVEDASTKRGYRLVGDVDYQEAKNVASYITPVPGGVGPMTIAMLLRNTLNACRRSIAEK